MNRYRQGWTLALCPLLLAACSQSDPGPEKEPMPMEQTVYGEQVKQLERAKKTAKEMEGRMQDLNEKLKENE